LSINKKMKTLSLYFLLLLMSLPAWGQQERKSTYNKEKLESAKVAFITQRLDLTPEQAEKFWPVYNQHSERKWGLMRSMPRVGNDEEITEQKARDLIEQKVEIEQKIVDVEKTFIKDDQKIIPPGHALTRGNANRKFTRHIYRMQKRKKSPSE